MQNVTPPPWDDQDEQAANERLPWGLYALFAGIIVGLLAGNYWPL